MARPCTVCQHPERLAIDKQLVSGVALRNVALRFAIGAAAVQRHRARHLPALLAAARAERAEQAQQTQHAHTADLGAQVADQEEQSRTQALDVMAELGRCVTRVTLMIEACDRWLRDPEDETRYEIGPRGEDVTVVYWGRGRDGKQKRKKTTLQDALLRLEGGGTVTDGAEYKGADPRKLLLESIGAMQNQMQLAVSAFDKIHNARELERFEATVLSAIEEVTPDVRERIVDSLRRHSPVRGLVGSAG